MSPLLVLIASANIEEARQIANYLVEGGIAACVQILPGIESVYRWEGEVKRDQEVLVLAKTSAALFGLLKEGVRQIHSYETPEIVGVPISEIYEPYRAWLEAVLQSPDALDAKGI